MNKYKMSVKGDKEQALMHDNYDDSDKQEKDIIKKVMELCLFLFYCMCCIFLCYRLYACRKSRGSKRTSNCIC